MIRFRWASLMPARSHSGTRRNTACGERYAGWFVEAGRDEARDLAMNDAGFKQGAIRIGLTPLQVWAIYFYKHIAAIETYVKNGSVSSEPIEGRIADAINYLILLRALIEETKGVPQNGSTIALHNTVQSA